MLNIWAKLLFIALLAFGVSLKAQAGPFGTTKGMKREELGRLIELNQGTKDGQVFFSKSAIVENPIFIFYQYDFSEADGLCGVRAYTKEYGYDFAQDAYEGLFENLSAKYGQPSMKGDNYAEWEDKILSDEVGYIKVQYLKNGKDGGYFVYVLYRYHFPISCLGASSSGL